MLWCNATLSLLAFGFVNVALLSLKSEKEKDDFHNLMIQKFGKLIFYVIFK